MGYGVFGGWVRFYMVIGQVCIAFFCLFRIWIGKFKYVIFFFVFCFYEGEIYIDEVVENWDLCKKVIFWVGFRVSIDLVFLY